MRKLSFQVRQGLVHCGCLSAWVGLMVWFLTLWHFSSQSHVELPVTHFPHLDKVLHFGYFGLGGLVAGVAFRLGGVRRLWVVVLVFGVVGLVDERHQSYVPGRSGDDWGDVVADVVGAVAGAWVGLVLRGWWGERGRNAAGRMDAS